MKLNVLVACEYSGIVRDEFLKLGHNAFSCDLLPCESTYNTDSSRHYQGSGKGKERSKFYPGIAQAMAQQYSSYILNHPHQTKLPILSSLSQAQGESR